MKRNLSLLLILFFNIFSFSQSFKIDWNESTVIDYGSIKVTVPFFNNEGFSFENGSVYLRMVEKSTGSERKASNMVWQKITSKDLFDLNDYSLPTKEESEVSYYTNPYTQEKTTNILVSTLKFEKGAIYRLSSFSLINAEKRTESNKSTSRIGTTDNPLKEGNFYKIKVDKSGVFKITAKFLRDNGMNPANINPKNFRIYGNGGLMLPEHNQDLRYDALQENAIQLVGEDDGVWNDSDYALFYAQGPNGYNIYKSNNGNGKRRIDTRTDKSNNFINSLFYTLFKLEQGSLHSQGSSFPNCSSLYAATCSLISSITANNSGESNTIGRLIYSPSQLRIKPIICPFL